MSTKEHKQREITFSSPKNHGLRIVHSKAARKVAQLLEDDDRVTEYETNVPFYADKITDQIDLRPAYLEKEWSSDFKVVCKNGKVIICEVIEEEKTEKKANIERLELSRRYWKGIEGIQGWKVVLVTGGGVKW